MNMSSNSAFMRGEGTWAAVSRLTAEVRASRRSTGLLEHKDVPPERSRATRPRSASGVEGITTVGTEAGRDSSTPPCRSQANDKCSISTTNDRAFLHHAASITLQLFGLIMRHQRIH